MNTKVNALILSANQSAEPANASESQMASPANDFPRELNRNARYLSSWSTNIVVVDVSFDKDLGKYYRTFDLEKIYLSCDRQFGGIYEGLIPLTQFPHLVDALKRVINLGCETFDKGKLSIKLGEIVRTCHNIFIWLVNRAIYWLKDVEKADAEELLDEVAKHSWAGVNRLEYKLIILNEQFDKNPEMARFFAGAGNGTNFSINIEELELTLGMPVGPQSIPTWYRESLASRTGDKRPSTTKTQGTSATLGETQLTASTLNLLANPRGEIDGLNFRPFPSALNAAESRITAPTQQTPNITPVESVQLTNESLVWVFDYGPKIATTLTEVRTFIDSIDRNELNAGNLDRKIKREIDLRFDALVESGQIPGDVAGLDDKSNYLSYVYLTMVSCATIIGMNHARRAKEIFGGSRIPYGTYYGCVRIIDDALKMYTSEFWVEKGIRNWRNFPANGLIADAVSLLEQFYRAFRAIGETFPPTGDIDSLRKMKLFFRRHLTQIGLTSASTPIPYLEYMRHLYARAGVDPAKWDGSAAPFRRMYVALSMRQYDLPELPATSRQLGHLGFWQTTHYAIDKHPRQPGQAISEIYSREMDLDTKELLDKLKEEGIEYFAEMIQALFSGKTTGGMFPRRVIKLTKRLSASASFSKLTLERKARTVAEILDNQGYAPTSMPHVACTAGQAKHTESSANCAENGKLQRKNATPETCSGCFHSWTNDSYQKNILNQAHECRAQSNLELTPHPVARELERYAEELELLYEKDRAIAKETKKLVEDWVRHWNQQLEGRS